MIAAIAPVLAAIDPTSTLDLISPGTSAAGASAASASAPADFGQMLSQVAGNAVSSLKTGEATAISGIQGKASVQQVVEAVMNAQQNLQTAIAVRDKMVSAYQELSRMAV
jgi:flagellar hook-basal body complex protein FliE